MTSTTRVEFDTTIYETLHNSWESGFEVHVIAHIAPAEHDVGIFGPWVDDMEIQWYNGRPLSKALYNSISQKGWDRLEEEALEYAAEPYDPY